MQYWIAPSGIKSTLEEKLKSAGLKPFSQANVDINLDDQEILLIYSAPDQILNRKRVEDSTATSISDMLILYEKTLSLSKRYRRSSSDWRLELLDTTSICRFCNNETPHLDNITNFPNIPPLAGLLTQEIIKKEPKIIDIYLDLELKSCLFGLKADSGYLQRLNNSSLTDLALMDWWEINIDREAFHEEVMNNLAQLTQIQNDYDSLVVEMDELRQSRIKLRENSTLRLKENKDLKSKIDLLTKENSKLVRSNQKVLSRSTLEEDVQASEKNRSDSLIKQENMVGYDSTNSIKSAARRRKTISPFMFARRLINIVNKNPK